MGIVRPARIFSLVNHCVKLPHKTGMDKRADVINDIVFDERKRLSRHAPRSGKAFFAYFLLPHGQKVRRGVGRSARGFDFSSHK
jgi:hypothetical protein